MYWVNWSKLFLASELYYFFLQEHETLIHSIKIYFEGENQIRFELKEDCNKK